MSANMESFSFKSESRQLLDLMVNSLYSNKEIFLRELISNSSDALDKLRFEALTNPELLETETPLRIRIQADSEAKTLTIEDNGIGMSRDEVIQNLGTIARSGTREFAAQLAEGKTEGEENPVESLIGQFGVGFYSSFMVATEVEVRTRKAGASEGILWRSSGDGEFQVASADKEQPGTEIILTLRDAEPDNGLADFTEEWPIRETVKKYSDFVQYPIELKVTRSEPVAVEGDSDAEASDETESAKFETIVKWETINSQKAIWTRSSSDVTDEEYAEFYKHIARDWEDPFKTIRFSAEGTFEYQALLFIPGRAPYDLFYRDQKFGLQLYANRVLIKDPADELLPEWLRFMKGVVDSPDLSLNVSREILQQDRRLGSIRKRIVKKTIETLLQLQKEDREKYGTFWNSFGRVLKEGTADMEHSDKVAPLLWFQSSNDVDGLTSLAEYVERMGDGQEDIYFMTGESRAAVEASPHLEAFLDKGIEVLYLVDPVDEIMVSHLNEFDGKSLKSGGKGIVDLGTEDEKKQAEEERKAKSEAHASLLELIGTTLEEHVKEVRLSTRLTSSAACLVGEENDISPGLEKILAASGQGVEKQKRILEINPKHALLERMQTLFDAEEQKSVVEDYAHLLHGQALIAEGSPIPDPAAFSRRLSDVMMR